MKRRPKTFREAWDAADSNGRYNLDERAALHEFEGRLSRAEAERRALKESLEETEQAELPEL